MGNTIKCRYKVAYNIMRLEINKCNCDVQNIVPTDKRFMYNPVRIKNIIIFEFSTK